MPNFLLRDKRQLVPRWHTSRKASKLLFPAYSQGILTDVDYGGFKLDKARTSWTENKNLPNAIDLFVRLKQTNQTLDDNYQRVTSFLLSNEEKLTPELIKVLHHQVKIADTNTTYTTIRPEVFTIIRKLKSLLKHYPDDPLTWMDLAFYYTVLDEKQKAEKCMVISYNLAPNHPFIARTHSRFLLHHKRVGEAMSVLKKTGLIKTHPLVASAALSISNTFNIGNMELKSVRKLLMDYKGNPVMLSDLAASLGTVEVENGSIKKGKKLIDRALISPSENAIAQAEWLNYMHGVKSSVDKTLQFESIEGEATKSYVAADFNSCRNKLFEMFSFQPFSDAPLVAAGYLSIIGVKDPKSVVDYSENRVPYSHMSFGELNNLIVAKMILGDTNGIAENMINLGRRVLSEKGTEKGTYLATAGMFEYSLGAYEEGSKLYEKAIEHFKTNRNESALALAKYFYSEQLFHLDKEKSKTVRNAAIKLAKKNRLLEVTDKLEAGGIASVTNVNK